MDQDFLPYGRQLVSDNDIEIVQQVLRSDFLTAGPRVAEFEEKFAKFVGAEHAVAMNSATAALHVAMRIANVGKGDRVITSPNTFLASANCAAFVGATPDFVDIDSVSYNLDPAALESEWKDDTKAVVAVHYAGQACDMPAIHRIATDRGALVIEDACHAVGGAFAHNGRNWKIGGHRWADISIFSFHPVKSMTTGEGGMLTTNNAAWAEKARRLRSHGVERSHFTGLGADADCALSEKGPWYYEMSELGYNYRMPDVLCGLGISQLNALPGFITRRRHIVAAYNAAFAGLEWLTAPALSRPENRELTSWHLYTVLIDFQRIRKTRTEVMMELRNKGIGTQVLYIPVYLQPWYRSTYGYRSGKCPRAEDYYKRALSLPLFPAMSESDVQRVIDAVRDLVAA